MAHPPTVLVIEDARPIREEIKRALLLEVPEARFLEADNGIDGFKALMGHQVDIVLCDLVMPQFDGFKFLQLKSTRREFGDIPVIMLTAIEDTDKKVEGLKQGANDYVTKPFHAGELNARVRVHLKIKFLQDELRQTNEKLTELSTMDALTRVYNRRHFLELAEVELSRAMRKNLPVSLMLLDLDHFKQVNDTFGHQVGDKVLHESAGVLKARIRNYDILGRYGGEEFTLLMPDTAQEGAHALADELRRRVQETVRPAEVIGRDITFSGGVASFAPGTYATLHTLIQRADLALYRAKEDGRNRIVDYTPEME